MPLNETVIRRLEGVLGRDVAQTLVGVIHETESFTAGARAASLAVPQFTLTYQASATTHDALTALPLTDETGGDDTVTTLGAVGDTSSGDESGAINDNLAALAAQVNALRADLIMAKQLLNAVIGVLQQAYMAD